MKKALYSSTAAKAVAFILAALIFTSLCVFGLIFTWSVVDEGYRRTGSFEGSDIAGNTAVNLLGNAYWDWSWSFNAMPGKGGIEELNQQLTGTNIHYSYQNRDGEGLITNGILPDDILIFTEEVNGRTWSVYRTAELAKHDELYYAYRFYLSALQLLRCWPFFAVFLLCEIGLMIFLACAAARRDTGEEFTTGWQERIPFDLYFLLDGGLAAGAVCILIMFLDESGLYPFSRSGYTLILLTAFSVGILLLAGWMTLCARVKTRTLWTSCLLHKLWVLFVRAVRWFFSLFPKLWRVIRGFVKLIPLMGRTLIFSAVYLVLLLITHICRLHFFFCLLSGAAFVLVLYYAAMLVRLQSGIRAISAGEQDITIDTRGMLPELKKTADELRHIRDGIALAVDAQLKSERMKTELITNVSHDIKTPLTNLVSYVDLLQNETDEEKRGAYLDVLARQAQRLKKLTEDLVDLSKSGSGAMSCVLSPRSLREMLNQALGEYEDRILAAGLEPVLSLPEQELTCLADGSLSWRVLDNLLGNACKYAQNGTRLYISASPEAETVAVEIKNISRDPLNIPAEELMERFKRGDDSRSTEGSGLGLNIADNLARLQGGSLSVSIDGDLFKAVYRLKKSE